MTADRGIGMAWRPATGPKATAANIAIAARELERRLNGMPESVEYILAHRIAGLAEELAGNLRKGAMR
jgi:hypothetical protein